MKWNSWETLSWSPTSLLCQHAMGWVMAREMVMGRESFSGFLLTFSEEVSSCMRGCAIMHFSSFSNILAFCLLSHWDQATGSFPPSLMELSSVYIVCICLHCFRFSKPSLHRTGLENFSFFKLRGVLQSAPLPGTHTILSDRLPEFIFLLSLWEE